VSWKIRSRLAGKRVSRPSAPTTIALLALFVSLGGTTYAAINLPANSVGTRQLKNGAVTGEKLGRNAVSSSQVKNGSLLAKDFRAGQLPVGPRGLTGARGPSDAFNQYLPDLFGVALPETSPSVQLGSLYLPQGDFVMFGRLDISNSGNAAQTLRCILWGPIVSIGLSHRVDDATVSIGAGEARSITLLGIAEQLHPQLPAYLECQGPTTGPLDFKDIQLGAIQVGTWQPPPRP
jgi:hypothetical protein